MTAGSDTTATGRRLLLMIDDLGLGGAQRLLETQVAFMPADTAVAIVNLGPETAFATQLRAHGATVLSDRLPRLLDVGAIRRLTREIRSWRPDVIHSHLRYANIVGGLIAGQLRLPHVVTLHSDRPDVPDLHSVSEWARSRLELFVLRRRTDIAIACGTRVRTARSRIVGRTPMVTVANRIPPVTRPSEMVRSAMRTRLGIRPGQVLMIAAGRLVPAKGFDLLLEAVARIDSPEDFRVLVVGSGPDSAALGRQIGQLGLEGRVMLHGPVDKLADLLPLADIAVLPSRYEGLPLTLIEAMAAGCAIVASRVGDIESTLGSGNALLVDPGAIDPLAGALEMLLRDPAKRLELGKAALEASEPWTDVCGFIAELNAVYDEAIGSRADVR